MTPWVVQSFRTFDSVKAVKQNFTVKLFRFKFYPVYNFGKLIEVLLLLYELLFQIKVEIFMDFSFETVGHLKN